MFINHYMHTVSGQQRSTLAGGKWAAAGREIKGMSGAAGLRGFVGLTNEPAFKYRRTFCYVLRMNIT